MQHHLLTSRQSRPSCQLRVPGRWGAAASPVHLPRDTQAWEGKLPSRIPNKDLSALSGGAQRPLFLLLFPKYFLKIAILTNCYLILYIFFAVQHAHLLLCQSWEHCTSTCDPVIFNQRRLQMGGHYITQKVVFFLNILKPPKCQLQW